MARLAQVTAVTGGHIGPIDEGIGSVVPTPIMRWLQAWTARSTSSTRPWCCKPRRASPEADVVVVLQALLDRHAMLRLRADDGAGDWSFEVPEPGSVDAGGCLQSVDVLSDEALVAARCSASDEYGGSVHVVLEQRYAAIADPREFGAKRQGRRGG